MLKLKYLVDNRDLAETILKKWDYNPNRLDLLDYYRISANAVYPFECNEQRCFLRFSPVEERTAEAVQAELEFIRFLRSEGYPAVDTVLSRAGKELEYVETSRGDYLAVVFKGVPGKPLTMIPLTDSLIFSYGEALGKLHTLSRKYKKFKNKRISWREQLDWVRNVLDDYPGESPAKKEADILQSCLERFPVSPEYYGLVHYDFELDNVFYDETNGSFHVIDFDEAVYHWFALDIEQSIDSLVEDMPQERAVEARRLFLEGYRSITPVDESMLSLMPVFKRYKNLYGYIRILRSVKEHWENEPEWMAELRAKLNTSMAKRANDFGKSLSAEIGD
jgi:Ser/Thr protein kinase RdoA (MazF antagonist)